MIRHAIPPARFFSQVPNEIVRHPRLSSDAVRLLTWQLSLPDDADESLSKTAGRAGIKKVGFLRAKHQLKDEGYLHEWREQVEGGRWRTRQLVSNVPLSAPEAALVRDGGTSPAPGGRIPTAGEPTRRAVGRHPHQHPSGNTSNRPPHGEATEGTEESPGAPSDVAASPEAARVVADLHLLDPRLRVPRGMLRQLAALAGQWLALGHTADSVRAEIKHALPADGRRVTHPGGLVRYVLRDAPQPPPPRPTPLVARLRECASPAHTQPLLFLPVGDEATCADCTGPAQQTAPATAPETGTATGAESAREALRLSAGIQLRPLPAAGIGAS